jgi:hypothetical protein
VTLWGAVNAARNRIRVLVALVVVTIVAAATVFVVNTRADMHEAQAGIATSSRHLSRLQSDIAAAVAARADARTALDHAREVLRADTEARDQLRATNKSEYRILVVSLQTLAANQAQLAVDARRAKLLDECLIGASQALNEAAVGDVVHLVATLPRAERLCAEADV